MPRHLKCKLIHLSLGFLFSFPSSLKSINSSNENSDASECERSCFVFLSQYTNYQSVARSALHTCIYKYLKHIELKFIFIHILGTFQVTS